MYKACIMVHLVQFASNQCRARLECKDITGMAQYLKGNSSAIEGFGIARPGKFRIAGWDMMLLSYIIPGHAEDSYQAYQIDFTI